MSGSRRRKARELVVQALYAHQVGGIELDEAVAHQLERRGPGDEVRAYVETLLRALQEHGTQLDVRIDGALVGWSPERVGAVERAILRLSMVEALHISDVPAGVAVDEGIELARDFASEDAARFIHAVLDRVVREDAQAESAGPPDSEAS